MKGHVIRNGNRIRLTEFSVRTSEEISMLRKFALVVAALGALALTALMPAPSEAAGVFLGRDLGSTVENPVEQVRCWHRRYGSHWRCHRRWNSFWW
jgi:hypothetical protein